MTKNASKNAVRHNGLTRGAGSAAPPEAEARPPGRVVINRKQLLQKVPMCERTILDMEKRGEFPRRFSLSPRLVGWDLQEIDEWIARMHVAGNQQPAPAVKC